MRVIISISLLLLLGIYSCRHQDKIPSSYIDRFYNKTAQLTELVALLRTDSFLIGKSGEMLGANDFDKAIREKLKSLGIDTVHYFSWNKTERQFDLVTNWRKVDLIHLTYNTLDTISTTKGFYKKDKNSNEIWGLGNSWTLWIERKLLNTNI